MIFYLESLVIKLQSFDLDIEDYRYKIKDDNKLRKLSIELKAFESSFIQLLGLILPVLVRSIRNSADSKMTSNILFHRFSVACYRVGVIDWDGKNYRELLEGCSKNIQKGFKCYNMYNDKNQLEDISKNIIKRLEKEIDKQYY